MTRFDELLDAFADATSALALDTRAGYGSATLALARDRARAAVVAEHRRLEHAANMADAWIESAILLLPHTDDEQFVAMTAKIRAALAAGEKP